MAEFEIHEKFEPLLDLIQGNPKYKQIDTVIVTGGRGSFKSYTVSGLLTLAFIKYNWKILYTRYTMAAAEDSVIAEITEKIDLFNWRKGIKQIKNRIIKNTSEKINAEEDYDNKNIPQIVFKGIKTSSGNQTANLKSLKGFNCFVLDEAEEHPSYKDFKKIQRSLRRKDLPNVSILILNPTTKTHWIYEELYEKNGLKDGDNCIIDNVMYIHMIYTDMIRFVSENNLRDFGKSKLNDPDDYKYNILGAFREKAEGVIFTNWIVGAFDDSLPVNYGLDFGISDPDALVKVAIDIKNKKIYLSEIFYLTNQNTDDLINNICKSVSKNELIIADSAGKRSIIDIRKLGYNIRAVTKRPGQVLSNIKEILNYQLIITPQSKNLIMELNNYCWLDKKGEVPIDKFNHLIDASRYAIDINIRRNK